MSSIMIAEATVQSSSIPPCSLPARQRTLPPIPPPPVKFQTPSTPSSSIPRYRERTYDGASGSGGSVGRFGAETTCQFSNIPWVKQREHDAVSSSSPKGLLQKELKDFIDWISPTEEERNMRNDVVNRISKTVLQLWPLARVEIIGSLKTELCLPMSDIDLVIFGAPKDVMETGSPLFQLSSLLEENRVTWPNGAKVITTAKVPIIKIQEMKSFCLIDIAFNVNTGIETSKIIQNFVNQYPVLRDLTLVIKYYLKQNFLNDTWTGGIGSYALVILIISYLQQEIRLHGKEKIEDSEKNLAELLLGFFELYGIKFNYYDTVISVKDSCYYDKKTRKWFNEQFPESLSVEDPCNPEYDVGTACFQIVRIKKLFEEAYNKLHSSIQQSCISYLVQSDIINPNFISKYRYHIKNLYGKNKESTSENSFRKRNLQSLRPHTDHPPQTNFKSPSKPSIPFIQIHYKNPKKTTHTNPNESPNNSWAEKSSNNNHYHRPNTTTTRGLATGKIKMDEFPPLIPRVNNNTDQAKLPSNSNISNGNGSKMDQILKMKMKKLSGISAIHN